MDDKTKNRIADMLKIDIKAFKRSTPYTEEEIVEQMKIFCEHYFLKLQYTKK